MAVGVDEIKITGRWVFDLERGEETTTRTIDIPYPNTDTSSTELQDAINQMNTEYTSDQYKMNVFIQPANWRDTNIAEEQWVTKGVHYEVVTTTISPLMPDTPETLGSAQEAQQEEHQEQQN